MSFEGARDSDDGQASRVQSDDDATHRKTSNNAATGATAGGARAIFARGLAFYFRTPIKAFFRTRVDYLAYARSINPRIQLGEYSWRTTTPGLLTHAVKTYGWRFIPDQLLPPLLANATVGAILYTSYLQILGAIHEPYSQSAKRVYPPPPPGATFTAGLAAGGIQSLAAAPLDALQVRFDRRPKRWEDKSMWAYGKSTLKEIGVRAVFAGWTLSLVKDSLGSAIFFSVFEYVKAQSYYEFIARCYSSPESRITPEPRGLAAVAAAAATTASLSVPTSHQQIQPLAQILKPHYVLEPAFLMLAGVAASIAQQGIIFPLTKIQTIHHSHLEELDQTIRSNNNKNNTATTTNTKSKTRSTISAYHQAYQRTWHTFKIQASSSSSTTIAAGSGGTTTTTTRQIASWLFRGFWWNSIRQTPATSAALVTFELVRRRYGVQE